MKVGEERREQGGGSRGAGLPPFLHPLHSLPPSWFKNSRNQENLVKYKLLKVPTRFSVVGGTEASRERTAGKAGEPASGRPSVPSDSLPLLCSAVIKGLSVVRWIPGILWACVVVCSPAPRTPHVRKFEARGRACRVIFKPGLHLITVSCA